MILFIEEEHLDAVNQSMAEKLSMKVGQLKNVSEIVTRMLC